MSWQRQAGIAKYHEALNIMAATYVQPSFLLAASGVAPSIMAWRAIAGSRSNGIVAAGA